MLKKMIKEALKEVLDIDEAKPVLDLKEAKRELESVRNQLSKTKIELNEVKAKKDLEEKQIKHLVKMKEEKMSIELEKGKQVNASDYQKKELAMQEKYHEEISNVQKEALKDMKEMYGNISDTLGKAVSVEISKGG